ncbi:SirA-like protein [Pullulanibacillus camelliae]|uniref:SirA-like protein n=1 Tax=Pullulanibacillus camelliae TaxID=1707096 RepID=A0A8J2YHY1_9BACL|nr:sulfurtransferase-like selenium metabolism protein YedF [Pullulanibacillus camelliae]GGE43558.1 SirA-like protein [Pullulanibacillus camelliae]
MSIKKQDQVLVSGSLDVRGESCPYPELYTLDAIKQLESGQILEVIADCPQSFINVPESAEKHGHKVLNTVKNGSTSYFYIQVK